MKLPRIYKVKPLPTCLADWYWDNYTKPRNWQRPSSSELEASDRRPY